jgi:toxin ParE1/3/4
VATFRLSRLAEDDLMEIGAYTLRTWGPDQALRYLAGLESACQMLANNPACGRPSDYVSPGLRRMEQGRHVIFYRAEAQGIFISRILHDRMLPAQNIFLDEEG